MLSCRHDVINNNHNSLFCWPGKPLDWATETKQVKSSQYRDRPLFVSREDLDDVLNIIFHIQSHTWISKPGNYLNISCFLSVQLIILACQRCFYILPPAGNTNYFYFLHWPPSLPVSGVTCNLTSLHIDQCPALAKHNVASFIYH